MKKDRLQLQAAHEFMWAGALFTSSKSYAAIAATFRFTAEVFPVRPSVRSS